MTDTCENITFPQLLLRTVIRRLMFDNLDCNVNTLYTLQIKSKFLTDITFVR